MTDAVKLDHVGVAIKDLERGRAAYERLGFTLTPRSLHRGSPSPGAPVIPFGSGNHCAMFRDGYLEIVGLTDPAIYSNIKSLVARYEGAHIVAFGVDSADAAYETLKRRGIAVEGVRKLERDAAYGRDGSDTRKAAFRNLYFDLAAYPESRMIFIEHLTPDVLWQPHLLDHPNGAVAIRDVFLCAADAQAVADKYAALFGADAKSTADGEWRIALARGSVWIATPEAWARRAPGAAAPALPSPAGIGFSVKDLAATRALLAKNGADPRDGADGAIWVLPADACGAAILFFQE
ncbi:MAG TPA: VOC family protein [Burkholderiales bacterium]|nr:VOC family protein [Burkholderiales bacterium]